MSKVALIGCDSYETKKVREALEKGIDLLGGIRHFVKPEEKILLKPNMLRSKKKEGAVTTHPAVMKGLIQILQEAECTQLFYGDSPGIGNPEKVAEEAGIKAVTDAYSVPLLEFSKGDTVAYPEGKATKSFEIATGVLETDALISVCKMKTHGLTRLTGAIKNQLGCVYGFNKGASHARYPDIFQFSRMLVDLNQLLKPRLYIMDGIVAMEGNGPASGNPVKMNVLLISEDPVALDTVYAHLVAIDPRYIPTIVAGEEMGLGTADLKSITLVGDKIETYRNANFDVERLPAKAEASGGIGALKFLRGAITRRPQIISERCVQCGICIASCPLENKAIYWETNRLGKKYPAYDYKRCIRCYCCQEMCPKKAITVKTPLLGKIFIYR